MYKISRITVHTKDGDRFTKKVNITAESEHELHSYKERMMTEYDANRVDLVYQEIDDNNIE